MKLYTDFKVLDFCQNTLEDWTKHFAEMENRIKEVTEEFKKIKTIDDFESLKNNGFAKLFQQVKKLEKTLDVIDGAYDLDGLEIEEKYFDEKHY